MTLRIGSLLLLLWLLGFAAFALTLPGPAGDGRTDAIVVLTGGSGRIERGIDLLLRHRARRMLVAGVNRSVQPRELARETHAPPGLFACCIDLDRESVDTRSNATQTAQWLEARHYRSVRLVTTDWHMPRARLELSYQLRRSGIAIVADGVPSAPQFDALFSEYNKFIVRRAMLFTGMR